MQLFFLPPKLTNPDRDHLAHLSKSPTGSNEMAGLPQPSPQLHTTNDNQGREDTVPHVPPSTTEHEIPPTTNIYHPSSITSINHVIVHHPADTDLREQLHRLNVVALVGELFPLADESRGLLPAVRVLQAPLQRRISAPQRLRRAFAGMIRLSLGWHQETWERERGRRGGAS